MASPPPDTLTQAIQQAVNSEDANDPVSNADAWESYILNGTVAPGVIATDGVRGFERKISWDHKKGKGQLGAVSTITGLPLADGTITSLLWTPSQFLAWNSFASNILLTYTLYPPKGQTATAAVIEYPALQLLGINNVVVEEVGIVRHLGKKLYSVTVKFREWNPPPAKNVTSTPKQAAPLQGSAPPKAPEPNVAAADAAFQQAKANRAAAISGASAPNQ